MSSAGHPALVPLLDWALPRVDRAEFVSTLSWDDDDPEVIQTVVDALFEHRRTVIEPPWFLNTVSAAIRNFDRQILRRVERLDERMVASFLLLAVLTLEGDNDSCGFFQLASEREYVLGLVRHVAAAIPELHDSAGISEWRPTRE